MLPGADRVDLVERLAGVVAGDEVLKLDLKAVVLAVVSDLLLGRGKGRSQKLGGIVCTNSEMLDILRN